MASRPLSVHRRGGGGRAVRLPPISAMVACHCSGAVTAALVTGGAVQSADEAKYPVWKGVWARWTPRNAGRDLGNVPS